MKYLKYIPWVLVVVLLVGVAVYYQQAERATQALLTAKNTELMKANLELGRAHTRILKEKELHKIAFNKAKKEWRAEIKKRDAQITLYAELEGKYKTTKVKQKLITKVVYKNKTIELSNEGLWLYRGGNYIPIKSLPIFFKDYRVKIWGDALAKTISYDLQQRFKGAFYETRLPSGGYNHYFYLQELDKEGNIVGELTLNKFEVFKTDERAEKMMWWNPKLDIQVSFGITHKLNALWVADLGLSASSYGKTEDDINWRFFRLGAGLSRNGFALSFSPVLYNLGKSLPFISNCYVSPSLGYDFSTSSAYLNAGIGLVF